LGLPPTPREEAGIQQARRIPAGAGAQSTLLCVKKPATPNWGAPLDTPEGMGG
jgi:hypothetical protein